MTESRDRKTLAAFCVILIVSLSGLGLGWLAPVEARTQDEAPQALRPTDELLEALVEQALAKDNVVESYELVVSVLEGAVTLNGVVDTRGERERAGAVVDDVAGVREVENRVQVKKEILPEAPSDEAICDRIVAALSNESEEDAEVTVKVVVEDGLAILTGVVSSAERRRELSELAFRSGAMLVRNEVKVVDEM